MTGQYRTRGDLITETLATLGVLSAGQPPDPEDYNYVGEKLDAVIRELAALEIVYAADIGTLGQAGSGNIPGMWFTSISDILAGECAQKFGATPDDQIILKANGLGGGITPAGPVAGGAGARA